MFQITNENTEPSCPTTKMHELYTGEIVWWYCRLSKWDQRDSRQAAVRWLRILGFIFRHLATPRTQFYCSWSGYRHASQFFGVRLSTANVIPITYGTILNKNQKKQYQYSVERYSMLFLSKPSTLIRNETVRDSQCSETFPYGQWDTSLHVTLRSPCKKTSEPTRTFPEPWKKMVSPQTKRVKEDDPEEEEPITKMPRHDSSCALTEREERRLEINRQRAKESRRRKKKLFEDMQKKIALLNFENTRLKQINKQQALEIEMHRELNLRQQNKVRRSHNFSWVLFFWKALTSEFSFRLVVASIAGESSSGQSR